MHAARFCHGRYARSRPHDPAVATEYLVESGVDKVAIAQIQH